MPKLGRPPRPAPDLTRVAAAAERAANARWDADRLQREYRLEIRRAREAGATVRVIAAACGVSFQSIAKLAARDDG